MDIEKDSAINYIEKDYGKILVELAGLPDDVDLDDFEISNTELKDPNLDQFKPDLIVKNNKTIIMFKGESSPLTDLTKKGFLAFVALYNYRCNDDDLAMYFVVLTHKEKTGVVTYKIGNIIEFNIQVVNIKDLDLNQIKE